MHIEFTGKRFSIGRNETEEFQYRVDGRIVLVAVPEELLRDEGEEIVLRAVERKVREAALRTPLPKELQVTRADCQR
jgi:hypothetical protein